jgi:metallo-beta-lactamase family protein
MKTSLSFHGAAGTVTGSCHLLHIGGLTIVVDCGMFQGGPDVERMNFGDFGFDPAEVDYLLLTHGHLDHCGRIPRLVAKGFAGKIICTTATFDIAKIVMMDSARIQEEDFRQWMKLNLRKGLPVPEPLYTTMEVLDAIGRFDPFVEYGERLDLNDQVRVTFRDAGHILGASFIELEHKGNMKLLFSGDLGNPHKPIIRDPERPGHADVAVIETTYGGRRHRNIEESVSELREVVFETVKRGGNVMIPSFAIERSQEMLYFFKHFSEEPDAPRYRVFLDSPMAIDVTRVMRKHPECFDEAMRDHMRRDDPFDFPGLEFTSTPEASMRINYIDSGAVIIAGSGMCTGGRIKHHFKHNIWRDECAVVFVGYQAEGTLGRRIVDGANMVPIFGENYKVRARVHTIGGFSSHADADGLMDWLRASGAGRVFLVHGEDDGVAAFKQRVLAEKAARDVVVPTLHEEFPL